MYRPRKSLLPLALVVGLFGTPMLGPAHAPGASGGNAHPPVAQLVTADPATRPRRRIRGRRVRGVLLRAVSRLRDPAGRIPPTGERIRSRRAHHDRLARGPPRSHAL